MESILVTGDFVLDYHIYEGQRQHYGDRTSHGVRMVRQTGGAALIDDLLNKLLERETLQRWTSDLAVERPESITGGYEVDTSQRAYAFWRPFPRNAEEDKQHWLVSEQMGYGAGQTTPPCQTWRPAKKLPETPDIIVLSDGGMGFRSTLSCWEALNFAAAEAIVLKTASPLFKGELWERLSKDDEICKKLVIVVSARELRKSTARISSGLSWEETLQNLLRDLRQDLKPLRRCRHLLVAFESEGGIWIDFADASVDAKCKANFVYDASAIEGDHAQGKKGGDAFGFLSCLTAAAAWQLKLNPQEPDLAAALEGGLSAMHDLRENGHGPASGNPEGFPAQRLAEVIKVPKHRYSIATFTCDRPLDAKNEARPDWSILQESRRLIVSKTPASSIDDLARLVVLNGPIALTNLPYLEIGNLLTVDRAEIEKLRTISQVVQNYRDDDSAKRPLSLGVFGPPGSGKSFAVKELAGKFVGKEGWMEFNLSQFNTPDDLIGAFHQIRDLVLKKLLPVAFFDEFDSQNYRWLQYLLAPMQDGKFQEGQLTHPLGNCILIFAGGTSWTFETFGPPEPAAGKAESKEFGEFRLAKGTDFRSRLDVYLNVTGPNRRKISRPDANTTAENVQDVTGHRFGDDSTDVYLSIRRALMIRGVLKCDVDQKLDIDEGLLHALLNAPLYKHGSRSLEKVLEPLKARLPDQIHRSSLVPLGQLEMHTKAEVFIDLLGKCSERPEPKEMKDADVDAMAPAIHDTYNDLGLKVGWKKPGDIKPYARLEDFEQESNRAAAERMPKILNLVGLAISDGGAKADELQLVRQHIEYHLELTANVEHEGWMRWHFERDWRYGPKKDTEKKLHHCLVPYRKLKDEDKNKDRTQIRNYPDFAARAGKMIVFK